MHSFGLDLSTDPRKAWWCELDWQQPAGTPLQIVDLGQAYAFGARDDATLATVLARRIADFAPTADRIAGIDAPIGWPRAFVQAISEWTDGDRPRLVKRSELRLRPTDRFVQEATGLTPMSVSTDRIGSTALLCAHVLSELADTLGVAMLDRARGRDGICEVYPAAALRLWSTGDGRPLASAGYKVESSSRERLLEQLSEVVELTDEHRDAMIGADDALDAMLCALVAGGVARGTTLGVDAPVRAGDLVPPSTRVSDPFAALEARTDRAEALRVAGADDAAREGWIHVPRRADLPSLLRAGGAAPADTSAGAAEAAPASRVA